MHGIPLAIKDTAAAKGLPTTLGCRPWRATSPTRWFHDLSPAGGGRDRGGQNQCAGVWSGLPHLQRPFRHHPQRLGCFGFGGRQQRWRLRCLGAAHAPGGRRLGLHGLAAQPGRLAQPVWHAPKPGTGAHGTTGRRVAQPVGHRRPFGASGG
ncbi:MAG: hypothetical protein R3E42_04905 [Burkholderiaceae bacterium]